MNKAEKIQIAKDDMSKPELPAMKIYWEHTRLNPDMYAAFEREALHLINLGHRKFSQWMVANHVRYLYHIVHTPTGETDKFKIPNGVISVWARRFILDHPEHNVFNIRKLK